MAVVLGKTRSAVQSKIRKLGLKRTVKEINLMRGKGRWSNKYNWTPEEDKILKRLYKTKTATEIAPILNRSLYAIKMRIHVKKLRISEREKARRRKIGLKFGHGWNKGMKGVCAPGCEKGWFKKGHAPANTKYDGCISARYHSRDDRYYYFIRTAKNKWQLLQRYVWEQANGKIPKNMVIRLKNGDASDCRLSNLEMITRKEHLLKNNPIDSDGRMLRYMKIDKNMKEMIKNNFPELIELKRNQLKLQREIRNVETTKK